MTAAGVISRGCNFKIVTFDGCVRGYKIGIVQEQIIGESNEGRRAIHSPESASYTTDLSSACDLNHIVVDNMALGRESGI